MTIPPVTGAIHVIFHLTSEDKRRISFHMTETDRRNLTIITSSRTGTETVAWFTTIVTVILAVGMPCRAIVPCCADCVPNGSEVDHLDGCDRPHHHCCNDTIRHGVEQHGDSDHQHDGSGHPNQKCPGCPRCSLSDATANSGPELRRVGSTNDGGNVIEPLEECSSETIRRVDRAQRPIRVGASEPDRRLQLQV